MDHPLSTPKWTLPEGTTLSRLTREHLLRTVESNAAAIDRPWHEVVSADPLALLSAEDAARVADTVVTRFQEVEGRKLFAGCEIAARERPDLYVLRSEAAPLEERTDWPEGVVADGDNVFEHEDVTGTVLVVREVSEVDRLMREGVPEGTIGVIDDAGGTMTAPILEEFDAVLCLAGTVRSHLGIIAREFGVPVLMNVRLARTLRDGETVTVSYSTEAQNVDAYYGEEAKPRAEVRSVESGG